jgi:hypothetical protein
MSEDTIMATKLGRSALPSGHSREDFECFGPVATKDTEFANCKLADLGCFKQDEGTDSNKYYHAAVVKSKINGKFYLYVEYGRTKDGMPSSPQFQMTECVSEAEAMEEFVDQCNAKNTKRGIWEKVGSKERFIPKPKKGGTEDLYVVRYMISRSVGFPSAKNICNADAVVKQQVPVTKTKKSSRKIDSATRSLFKDLLGGTLKYTRSVMVGNTMPAFSAIKDARDLLDDALAQVKKVGNKVDEQVADPTLKKLTYNLYGMIPKSKPQGASEATWILSQENIGTWQNDLDAFETALQSTNIEEVEDDDVMQGIPATVESIDLNSELGKHLTNWWINSTRRKHGHADLKIHNLWKVERNGDYSQFNQGVEGIASEMPKSWNNERPMFYENQKQRPDLTASERKIYHKSNTALLFHGTRAVNVAGIIRESLRFPNQLVGVVINGAMFGPGVYSADDWGKSANYCSVGNGRSMYAGHSGHIPNRRSFMFAVDVCLGNPFVAKDAHGYTKAPDGHHCVFGKAGHTSSWGNYGGLQNNEWIIYRKNQIVLKYLAELSWY